MTAMTEAAFAAVSAALKRGDSRAAMWWLTSIGIDEHAKKIFEQTVNPEIYPEGLGAVIDELAAQRVDEFLVAKGVLPLERLRIREAMTAKELEALNDEYDKGNDA